MIAEVDFVIIYPTADQKTAAWVDTMLQRADGDDREVASIITSHDPSTGFDTVSIKLADWVVEGQPNHSHGEG